MHTHLSSRHRRPVKGECYCDRVWMGIFPPPPCDPAVCRRRSFADRYFDFPFPERSTAQPPQPREPTTGSPPPHAPESTTVPTPVYPVPTPPVIPEVQGTGWQCPCCGLVHAPWVSSCGCAVRIIITPTTTTIQ